MIRTILEIIYLLTILYLTRHYYKLFLNVVKLRRETKTSIGSKDEKLERAIRAHSNFCETVPITLLLSFILYFNNLLYFATPAIIILAIGRTIHSKTISDINEDISQRRKGMRLTIFSIIFISFGIFFYILQLIHFSFQNLH